VGLAGTERRRQVVVASKSDTVLQIPCRCYAISADARVIALNRVGLSAIVEFDAIEIETDDVTGRNHGSADGVRDAARDFDSEETIAFGCAGKGAAGAGPHRAGAGSTHADEISPYEIVGGGRPELADDVDAIDRVARDDVASLGCGSTNGAVVGI